jgi:hypothetical protein
MISNRKLGYPNIILIYFHSSLISHFPKTFSINLEFGAQLVEVLQTTSIFKNLAIKLTKLDSSVPPNFQY